MNTHPEMIANALHFLIERQADQPGLAELALHLERSEAHVQKIFQAHVGLSPKQFLGMLTRERALARLKAGATVLDASLDSGLSGPGRLHDLLISTDALTPGEARRRGAGVDMQRGVGTTPFGPALLAWTTRGITFLGFTRNRGTPGSFRELEAQWPDARFIDDDQEADRRLDQVFSDSSDQPLKIWLRGSPFQLKVWEALLSIPPGYHASYGQLAARLGRESASRAVGTAIGRNPISWLIPCHRVITRSGTLGGYRWGLATKQAMIGVEASRESAQEPAPLELSSQSATRSAASSGAGTVAGSSAR